MFAAGGEESGLWSSIKSTFSSGGDSAEEKDEGLNIFCLATGHLYERLLKEIFRRNLKGFYLLLVVFDS
jgi:hypothetical protein